MIGNPLLFGLAPLGGMNVYEEPLPPAKIQLREHIQVTEECRREMNAWLLAMFGRKTPALDLDTCLVSEEFGFLMVPHGMARRFCNVGS